MTEPLTPFRKYLADRSGQPTLADAAIALNVPVFPCNEEKKPLPGTHGFQDATRDPAAIRRMFADSRAVMIGMPTGPASGWVVVDVDVRDGAQGQAWLDDHTADLVPTRTVKTRSGGWHLYFQNVPGMRNSASKIAPGVDVRGEGGYVIVNPSPGYVLADPCEAAEMPDWLVDAATRRPEPAPVARPASAVVYDRDSGGSAYGLAALERECDAIRYAADGTKHAAVNKAAYSIGGLVTAGELPDGLALSELMAALNAIRASCKDFKAAERTLRRSFQDGKGLPRQVPERLDAPVEGVHPAAGLIEKMWAKETKRTAQPQPIPVGMMDVGGAIGMFMEHCEQTAISPQPLLAMAAGICLVGVLAGRRYRTETNLRSNVYAVGIADSGGGKDHARKAVRDCLNAAELTKYLGGETLASGRSLLTSLEIHPARLFQIDEFGDFLADVLGQKASAHRREIAANLKTLYSSAGSFMLGTEYANQKENGTPRVDIQQPHACLYATTTPGQFHSAVDGKSLHDGLMARIMLFESPCSYPDEADPQYSDPPEELLSALRAIAAGGALGGPGNLPGAYIATMSAKASETAIKVPNTPGAQAAYKALRLEQLSWQRQNEGTYVTAIAGRFAENAMKLALIRAVSRNPADPAITEDDVAWGRLVARHCINTTLSMATDKIADTEYEAKLNDTLAIIKKHGPITQNGMLKHGFKKYKEGDRPELLRTLLDSGDITSIKSDGGPGKGKPSIKYVISTHLNAPLNDFSMPQASD